MRYSCPLGHSTLTNEVCATERRASRGHSVNQSMVQQLTKLGNIRHRERNASPTGLMHNTTWRLFRTRLMKKLNIPSRSPSAIPASLAAGRQPITIRSYSSASNRFGTSPLFKMLFMSSRNSSTTIYKNDKTQIIKNDFDTVAIFRSWYLSICK